MKHNIDILDKVDIIRSTSRTLGIFWGYVVEILLQNVKFSIVKDRIVKERFRKDRNFELFLDGKFDFFKPKNKRS